MIFAELGATVIRIVDSEPAPIDRDVTWGRAWHRDKQVIRTNDYHRIRELLLQADVALVYGGEDRIEDNGFGYVELSRAHASLIYARCRPSRTSRGIVADYGFLVEACTGFCSQLQGHRQGPILVDARASGAGAAFLLTASVLALLRRRTLTGIGGWSETSLYDGMLATLGTMIGRPERAPEHVDSYWAKGSTFPNFMYRCADDALIQVWFGGKGMYEKLIQVLGDEPSSAGYYAEQVSGMLNQRAVRWRSMFAERPRDVWMEQLRAAGVACEPVLAPGDALSDPHLRAAGIAVEQVSEMHHDVVVSSGISVEPVRELAQAAPDRGETTGGLLAGVRVLDFSAFVAGPLSAQVLADLGADVIKVEPPEGEAMRAAAYAIAACQRGKRSLAIDIAAPSARPVIERLIRWADVVMHNFRVGVASRLGIDESAVAQLNPNAVYCHASAFGATGPRAMLPGNDALMQALSGFERALGGAGNDPIAATWIPIDMSGGWLGAIGALAGLYLRAKQRQGQRVHTSLLGAAMLLQSGVYQRDGEVVRQPELDRSQTGYGPGYRLYECSDGQWLAVVIPNPRAWERIASLPQCAELPHDYVAVRRGAADMTAQRAEDVLASALATAPAVEWSRRLLAAGAFVEIAGAIDRDQFRRQILDDPLNQQLHRAVAYQVRAWGTFEQLGSLLRCGPHASARPREMLPEIGEHSIEVLRELGFEPHEISALLEAKVVRQLG
jgi:crotonobetainyl-CoA:carnitine CoA-transferase CaiB-like acyl-CoA transferase